MYQNFNIGISFDLSEKIGLNSSLSLDYSSSKYHSHQHTYRKMYPFV